MSGAVRDVPGWVRRTVPIALIGVMGLLLLVPPGENLSRHDLGRILGQFTFQFLLVSLFFAYRRPLGRWIGEALRTRFHRGLGLTVLALSVLHGLLLLTNGVQRGWLTGTVSIVLLALHGVMGFWKPSFLRRWGQRRWRYVHLATAWAGLLIGLEHALFYGQHYGLFREAVFGADY